MFKKAFTKAATILGLSAAVQATPALAMPITNPLDDRDYTNVTFDNNGKTEWAGNTYEEGGYSFTVIDPLLSHFGLDQNILHKDGLTTLAPWAITEIDHEDSFAIDNLSVSNLYDTGRGRGFLHLLLDDGNRETFIMDLIDDVMDFNAASMFDNVDKAFLGANSWNTHLFLSDAILSTAQSNNNITSVDGPQFTFGLLALGLGGIALSGRRRQPA